jgi:hypothetical protein
MHVGRPFGDVAQRRHLEGVLQRLRIRKQPPAAEITVAAGAYVTELIVV